MLLEPAADVGGRLKFAVIAVSRRIAPLPGGDASGGRAAARAQLFGPMGSEAQYIERSPYSDHILF